MKGQLMELMFYPLMAAVLLSTFAFLSREEASEVRVTRSVLDASDAAIEASNLVLLNCTPDHHLGCVPPLGTGSYYVRRLDTDGETVKELIFPAPG